MRKILFRGKYIDNGEWIEGYPLFEKDDVLIMRSIEGEHKGIEFNTVFEDTVSEFTGLYDNNGKMVFEGDIIQDDERILLICFYEGNFCYIDLADECRNPMSISDCDFGIYIEGTVIIGNKWDNPELLEE